MAFALLLARTMGMTLATMDATMSSGEFALHYADYRRNPWGPQRDEFNFAMLASATLNGAGAKTTPSDFMPYRLRAESFNPEAQLINLMGQ